MTKLPCFLTFYAEIHPDTAFSKSTPPPHHFAVLHKFSAEVKSIEILQLFYNAQRITEGHKAEGESRAGDNSV